MKNLRYCFGFAGLLLLCLVVGTGFFIYCDSATEEGSKEKHPQIEVQISVVNGEIILNPDLIEAHHRQKIRWYCEDSKVLDFLIFLGGNSPIGEVEIEGDELDIHTDLRPEDGKNEITKRAWHNPEEAGGKIAKYFVAVYYDDPDDEEPGRILMKDPEIIIPPRR